MEYCALGDLLGLLRKSRGVHDKYHLGEGSIEELGIYDLVSFAKQIATGMVFLGSRGVRVHLLHLKRTLSRCIQLPNTVTNSRNWSLNLCNTELN